MGRNRPTCVVSSDRSISGYQVFISRNPTCPVSFNLRKQSAGGLHHVYIVNYQLFHYQYCFAIQCWYEQQEGLDCAPPSVLVPSELDGENDFWLRIVLDVKIDVCFEDEYFGFKWEVVPGCHVVRRNLVSSWSSVLYIRPCLCRDVTASWISETTIYNGGYERLMCLVRDEYHIVVAHFSQRHLSFFDKESKRKGMYEARSGLEAISSSANILLLQK